MGQLPPTTLFVAAPSTVDTNCTLTIIAASTPTTAVGQVDLRWTVPSM